MTEADLALVIEALSTAAGRLEHLARQNEAPHFAERAKAMRSLRTSLCRERDGLRPLRATVIALDVTGLTEAELVDLRAHVRGKQPGAGTYDPPQHGWTCFHCGETFTSIWGARTHFGTPDQARPLCVEAPAAAAIARRRAP